MLDDDDNALKEMLGNFPSPNLKLNQCYTKEACIQVSNVYVISLAAFYAAEKCFQILLDADADISRTDFEQSPLIFYAIAGGSRKIVTTLIEDKKVSLYTNHDDVSIMDVACLYGHLDLVKYFYTKRVGLQDE